MHILRGAKRLARAYYEFTKKPIGVTGEIAEFEAHRLLPHPEMWPFVTPLIGWRPRRDLNPCYRRERAMS